MVVVVVVKVFLLIVTLGYYSVDDGTGIVSSDTRLIVLVVVVVVKFAECFCKRMVEVMENSTMTTQERQARALPAGFPITLFPVVQCFQTVNVHKYF
jgi:hypothetical protein